MLDLFPQTELAFLFPLSLQTHLHLLLKQETVPSHLQESTNQEKNTTELDIETQHLISTLTS